MPTEEQKFQEWYGAVPATANALAAGQALEIALAVEVVRQEKGWSYAELARNMGVSRAYIHRLMQGSENSTLLSLNKLAEALGCELIIRIQPKKQLSVKLRKSA